MHKAYAIVEKGTTNIHMSKASKEHSIYLLFVSYFQAKDYLRLNIKDPNNYEILPIELMPTE